MKRPAPKPRNHLAKELWTDGAYRPRTVPDKKKAAKHPRKSKHKRKATE